MAAPRRDPVEWDWPDVPAANLVPAVPLVGGSAWRVQRRV